MTIPEAKNLLAHHSFRHENFSHPKSERGFLGMLRPFNGTLLEDNFHEVMAIIKVLSEEISLKMLDREIVTDIWAICHLGRAWAIHPEGMLRKNGLITEDQVQTIDR